MIFKNTLIKVAKDAGAVQLRHFGKLKRRDVRRKAHDEFVTDIDKQSERLIIPVIKKYYPKHSIISEESAASMKAHGEYTWIIDPLDGTTNYSIGNPLFGVSICVMDSEGPLEGVAYFPFLRQWYYARRGYGTYLGNQRVTIACNSFNRSILTFGYPHTVNSSRRAMIIINRLRPQVANIRILGSSVFSACLVASGAVDGIVLVDNQHVWDVYPGILFITEAGGKVSDFAGRPWTPQAQGLIASTPKIHQQLVRRLP